MLMINQMSIVLSIFKETNKKLLFDQYKKYYNFILHNKLWEKLRWLLEIHKLKEMFFNMIFMTFKS